MLQVIVLAVCISLIILLLIVYLRTKRKKSTDDNKLLPDITGLLEAHVPFYRKLDSPQRTIFENRIRQFLADTKVTGIGITVTDLDRLLVGASAIVPIAAFPDWQYRNISEVLLYPDTFNKDYATEGADRNVLGMVGEGAMNGQMILSQRALREGFAQEDGYNTGIHEFVHLIDKADGSTDGIPEYLLSHQYAIPWVAAMRREINKMRQYDTDINPYGATNDAEFFAVVGEYFFERPDELQANHPELFELLSQMFGNK